MHSRHPSSLALLLLLLAWFVGTAAFAAEPVAVERDGAKLVGELHLPCTQGPHPLVVVLHAASSPTRDLALYEHLRQVLPPLGIAVAVYDRRGSGDSVGLRGDGAYSVLADDGIAVARQLATDPRIDGRRIGFWGLSQGGWLSVLALQRWPEAAFAISVSAPMVTPDVQMMHAVGNVLRINGYSPAQVERALDLRRQVDAHMRGELAFEPVRDAVEAARGEPWFADTYIGQVEPREVAGWAREMAHDPLDTLSATRQPLLVVYGSEDPWIPVEASVERLHALGAVRPDLSVYVAPGADHALMHSFTPAQQVNTALFPAQRPESPDYFAVMAAWLAGRDLAAPAGRASCRR